VYFNVLPGVATEAVCVFDLETPKLQLESFGFFHEKIDAGGRLATGPSRRLPGVAYAVERRHGQQLAVAGPSPLVVRVLAGAIFAMCVLIGFVAWPRLMGGKKTAQVTFLTTPSGAQIELEGHNVGTTTSGGLAVADLEVGRAYAVIARIDGYEPKQQVVQPRAGGSQVTIELHAIAATVDVDTTPTGASIIVDDKELGQTPLSLTSLAPGSAVTLTFRKTGYQDAIAKLDVPGPGKQVRLVQPLAVAAEFARVKLTSEPSGATVTQNGNLMPGVLTPAEILVEAGKPARFVISMPHKVPAVIESFTPGRGADGIKRHVKLVDGVNLHVETSIDGRVDVANATHCQGVATPADCVLAKGTYTIDFTGASNAHVVRKIAIADKDVTERLEFGFVDAASGKTIVVAPGTVSKHVAYEVGPHQVTVNDESGTHPVAVRVKAGQTVVVN
ncbi:MAG TPA: PEGA domain-containing protein, partial [Kofleriaceae bacterium]